MTTTYINANGILYFSKISEDGLTIYSFTEDFEDTWSQEDEDLHALPTNLASGKEDA